MNHEGDLGDADGIYLDPFAKIPTPPLPIANTFVGFALLEWREPPELNEYHYSGS